MKSVLLVGIAAAAAGALMAQTAAVSGVVRDQTTGQPLANYTVSTYTNSVWLGNAVMQSSSTKEVKATTDAAGHYRLGDLPPGSYRLEAHNPQRPSNGGRRVAMLSGSDLEGIDIRVIADGMIGGQVLDENHDPLPGVQVRLVSREYNLGNLGYYYANSSAMTNDQGKYTLVGVRAGWNFAVVAEKIERDLAAHSEVPLDPKLRKPVLVRTFYPNSPAREGAQAVSVRPGERRQGVDIVMRRASSYCVEGTALGPVAGAPMRVGIEATQPASGVSGSFGSGGAEPFAITGSDGAFRLCDLSPAAYRLTVQDATRNPQAPVNFAATDISIVDRDIQGLKLAALPAKDLEGEVVWAGDPPPTPVTAKFSIALGPLFGTGPADGSSSARPSIPATFTLKGLVNDDYVVRTFLNAPGLYIKDIVYGGQSALYAPLHVGSAIQGSRLRVVMAHDGATLKVQVNDKDGNPVTDSRVVVLPAETRSEGELAARLMQGMTNQAGQFTPPVLPPGKYFVAALDAEVDPTPESIGRLWQARNRFQEMDAAPGATVAVKVTPGSF